MPGKRSYAFATTARDSPAGQAELIFERYRRGEHTSPVPGGTGLLGLYVARQIVQAHDGKLWLAEHGPDGCTFYSHPSHGCLRGERRRKLYGWR
ncbi:ATP-binding protein [Klebsiella pneumoniae subsp. pneumoniae]|nr:ATP-binding protein [Klebsiella pneumoniae subsp. pneumoniae]